MPVVEIEWEKKKRESEDPQGTHLRRVGEEVTIG